MITTPIHTNISDRRTKKNIKSLNTNVLDKINKINIVNFQYNLWDKEIEEIRRTPQEEDKSALIASLTKQAREQHIGVIAQELREIFPDAVLGEDPNILAVKPDNLIFYLIKGLQEQQKQIDELKTQVKELQAKG